MKKPKRTSIRRMTLEARIIRYMRITRGISVREAGKRVNVSDSLICQFETGRADLNEMRIDQLVAAYGYPRAEFDDYRSGKPLPILSIKDECIRLLEQIDETKLKAVHAVLTNFIS